MKKILATQLDYVVHKSNFDLANKELARLKRIGASDEDIAKAKARVDYAREKSNAAREAINAAGVSKTFIGK